MKRAVSLLAAFALLGLAPLSALARDTKVKVNPYQLKLPTQTDYKLVTNARLAPYRVGSAQPELKALENKPFGQRINELAQHHQVDPALVHAVIHVESRYRVDALSPKGAVGLMQVLPETALRFGITDPSNPEANLTAGIRYLRLLLDRFDQRLELAIAAYNAGEGAVERYGNEIPPYPETQAYVPAVLDKYDELTGHASKQRVYLPGTRLDPKAVGTPP